MPGPFCGVFAGGRNGAGGVGVGRAEVGDAGAEVVGVRDAPSGEAGGLEVLGTGGEVNAGFAAVVIRSWTSRGAALWTGVAGPSRPESC